MSEQEVITKKQRREQKKEAQAIAREAQQRKKNLISMMLWSGVIVVLGLIVWGLTRVGSQTTTGPSLEVGQQIVPITANDHVKGSPDAQVIITEYSDFQCPACASYEPLLDQLSQEFGDQIAIVYRHFPLRTIHRNAEMAARAAEAAGQQGAFWQMHDLLFARQSQWSTLGSGEFQSTLVEYAEQLNLDQELFERALGADDIKDIVQAQYTQAVTANLQGTPSFFINGRYITNPNSYDQFKQLISTELAKAGDFRTPPTVAESNDDATTMDQDTMDVQQ